MLLDEQGFLEAPGFVLLLLLSALLGIQALTWQKRMLATREHHKQVLCLKKTIGVTHQLVKRVNILNRMLAAGSVGQAIGVFFPGAGWIMALNWEKAKKAIKALQEAAWYQAERELLQQLTQGCRISWKALRTPFSHQAIFEREVDVAVLRTNEESWQVHTPLMKYHITWTLKDALTLAPHWKIE